MVCLAPKGLGLMPDGGGSLWVVLDDQDAVHFGVHSKHDHVGVKDICAADGPDAFGGVPGVKPDVAGLAAGRLKEEEGGGGEFEGGKVLRGAVDRQDPVTLGET